MWSSSTAQQNGQETHSAVGSRESGKSESAGLQWQYRSLTTTQVDVNMANQLTPTIQN